MTCTVHTIRGQSCPVEADVGPLTAAHEKQDPNADSPEAVERRRRFNERLREAIPARRQSGIYEAGIGCLRGWGSRGDL